MLSSKVILIDFARIWRSRLVEKHEWRPKWSPQGQRTFRKGEFSCHLSWVMFPSHQPS
jgi:hypothetical protein